MIVFNNTLTEFCVFLFIFKHCGGFFIQITFTYFLPIIFRSKQYARQYSRLCQCILMQNKLYQYQNDFENYLVITPKTTGMTCTFCTSTFHRMCLNFYVKCVGGVSGFVWINQLDKLLCVLAGGRGIDVQSGRELVYLYYVTLQNERISKEEPCCGYESVYV